MPVDPMAPSRAELEIIREEEALLARAQGVLSVASARARPPEADGLRSIAGLRALREEAMSASEDDLPALLLEMSVRQRLCERSAEAPLPDTASPYLAHLAIRDQRGLRDYLLGRESFLDPASGVRIVDWRVAPVARIFYRYREGDEFEESFPGRDVEGVVVTRRVVVIEGGLLVQIVGDDLVLERRADGRWIRPARTAWSFAEGGAGTAARPGVLGTGAGIAGRARPADVTALLDARQFAAVTAPAEQPLVVLGSAGSGKTTVALHRLARITAADPAQYPLARMEVIVPEEGLARLSARLLEPLAGGAVRVRTLDAWSLDLACRVFGDELPRGCVEAPALVASLKRSPALHDALFARFGGRSKPLKLKAMRRRLAELFTDRPFLTSIVEASGGTLSRAAVEATVEHTMLQLAEPLERQLRSIIVPEMKQAVDGRPIAEATPDELAGTLDVEDLPILLCMRAWQGNLEAPSLAHVVVDEAEDFSLFELFVLGKLLAEPRSVTLAGDEAQQTSSNFAGWERALTALGVRDAATCRLAVSYRCPRPVVDLARQVLGDLAPEAPAQAVRDGAPVGFFNFPDPAAAHLFLAGALRDLLDREPRASVAVIAEDAEAARRFHALVEDAASARLVLAGEFSFEPGIDVTDVDNCKGLEFDYVVVPDATADAYPSTDVARRRLHVALTRTSHQLWVVSGGAPSPLLGEPARG
ncbi:UvrD/Rep helicase family protein [Minicystis rosea]|nr:UvrD/Rep helicase family protein [Minicystis rosea]